MTQLRAARHAVISAGVVIVLLVAFVVFPGLAQAGAATRTASYQPDAWIKLCGAGDTCKHAAPHPYLGEDIFNTTGSQQSVSAGMEEGNDIRFWILLENDGTLGDTFTVHGCSGNGAFVIRAVLVGAYRFATSAPHITTGFEQGTATFTLPPSTQSQDVILTLDILAQTTVQGAKYSCPIVLTSNADPTIKDKVIAKMFTT